MSASSAAQGGGGAGRMHYAWAGMLGEQRMSRALRGVVPLQGLRCTHFISPAEASTAGEESLSVKWGASWAARPKQRQAAGETSSYTNARDCMHWHVPVVIQGKRPIGAYDNTAHQTNTSTRVQTTSLFYSPLLAYFNLSSSSCKAPQTSTWS